MLKDQVHNGSFTGLHTMPIYHTSITSEGNPAEKVNVYHTEEQLPTLYANESSPCFCLSQHTAG